MTIIMRCIFGDATQGGDAKFQLETMTDEEWRETSKQWFEEHIDRIIELFPNSFTPEQIAEANRVRELLCEY